MTELVRTNQITITEYCDLDGCTSVEVDFGDNAMSPIAFLGMLELAKWDVMSSFDEVGNGDD